MSLQAWWRFTGIVPLLPAQLVLKVEREEKAKQPTLTGSSAARPAAPAAFAAFLWTVTQTILLWSLPLTVDPNVRNNIDGQPQNSIEQSIRPSVREAE